VSGEVQRRRGFDGPSHVRTNNDPVFPWVMTQPLGYWIENEKLDLRIQRFSAHFHELIRLWGYSPLHAKVTVFENFPTDFASVPRWAWSIVSRDEIRRPAVFHDAFYRDAKNLAWRGWLTKRELYRYRLLFDRVFREAMKYCEPSIPEWKRLGVYYAVRVGGKIA